MAQDDPVTADKRYFIMPTPLNVLSEVHQNIVRNLRRGKQADLELPSLYRLGYAVTYNTGEMMITQSDSEEQ